MRVRRASPLLLLLLSPCLVSAQADSEQARRVAVEAKDTLSKDDILALNRARDRPARTRVEQARIGPDDTLSARGTQATRAYKGTEDAPVDGLDGKPHAGPFVDTTPEDAWPREAGVETSATKSVPTSLGKFRQGAFDIPEKNDGVMNDENRPVPKKGTTGTEDGMTAKDKERKANGNLENKPPEPKESPPVPHSELAHSDDGQDEMTTSPKKENKDVENDGRQPDAPTKKGGEYGAGGHGLEKPSDLPEKPHNLPYPIPKRPTMPESGSRQGDEPPVGPGNWLVDTMPYTEGKTNPKPAKVTLPASDDVEWHEWFHSFVLSLTMILFSEIGDKTFLIAALMAMRHPRLLVFSAAFAALIAMTILSAILGHAVPTLLPKRFTTFAAALLFLVFGVRMLREGLAMSPDTGVGEEMKEVEAELEEKEHNLARRSSRRRSSVSPYVLEAGRGRKDSSGAHFSRGEPSPPSSREDSPAGRRDGLGGLTNLLGLVLSPAWVQTFIMTFLGEWGDRSQIATIAMAAGQDYWWVTLGAVTGHACCTGVAVLGGRALAGKVSMRVVTIGGAVAFLVFGVIYLYECISE